MTDTKAPEVEILPGPRRAAARRHYTPEEKRCIVEERIAREAAFRR
jgi:hypothetical protein